VSGALYSVARATIEETFSRRLRDESDVLERQPGFEKPG
jgi:hypothetical protein